MNSGNPFILNLYWNSTFEDGNQNDRPDGSLFVEGPMCFSELEDKVYATGGWDKNAVELSFLLACTDHGERRCCAIQNDNHIPIIYHLAHRWPQLYITVVQRAYRHEGASSSGAARGGGEEDYDTDNSEEIRGGTSDSEEPWPSSESAWSESDSEGGDSRSANPYYVYADIGNFNPENVDRNEYAPQMWDGNVENIQVGLHFSNKEEVVGAVALWSARKGRPFRVKYSDGTRWHAYCATQHASFPQERRHGTNCVWVATARKMTGEGTWQLRTWAESHNCPGVATMQTESRNITSRLISYTILAHVQANPQFKVADIQTAVETDFLCKITYKKAWHAKRHALDSLYGTWTRNFAELPRYMAAIVREMPGTRVDFQFQPRRPDRFRYVFWSFAPCIFAFHHTFPVVMIDGTHLRGSYKGKLLTAMCKSANNRIIPLAFAVIGGEETKHCWRWFLDMLRIHVLLDRFTCFVSDRNAGLISAFHDHFAQYPNTGVRRFCLRHVRSNLLTHCRANGLSNACWRVGTELRTKKFVKAWADVGQLHSGAQAYLQDGLTFEDWTLYEDGGHRWGNTTTNIAESFNHVLKDIRFFPIRAMVESSLEKCINVFNEVRAEIAKCNTFMAEEPLKKYNKWWGKAGGHRVTTLDADSGVYKVKTGWRRHGKGGNLHRVRYHDQTCTCGKWQTFRIPCSHAMAVDRKLKFDNTPALVSEYYKLDGWRAQFSGQFSFVSDTPEDWPQVEWTLQPDFDRLAFHGGPGRRRMTRFSMSMDYQNQSRRTGNRMCSRCRQTGHNARSCPLSHPPADRVHLDRIYNQDGQHDL